MTLNGVMAVTLCYFTEFGKHMRCKHITAASSCGGIYAGVYCILYHVYDVVVKKVHVRYISSPDEFLVIHSKTSLSHQTCHLPCEHQGQISRLDKSPPSPLDLTKHWKSLTLCNLTLVCHH